MLALALALELELEVDLGGCIVVVEFPWGGFGGKRRKEQAGEEASDRKEQGREGAGYRIISGQDYSFQREWVGGVGSSFPTTADSLGTGY